MEAELPFRTGEKPLGIAPVLPDHQTADDKGQHHNDRVRVAIPGDKGKAGACPKRSQGHVPGQNRQNQKSAPDHQGNAPIHHQRDGAAGEDALAALEMEQQGNI